MPKQILSGVTVTMTVTVTVTVTVIVRFDDLLGDW
jgi:hypothetical protein